MAHYIGGDGVAPADIYILGFISPFPVTDQSEKEVVSSEKNKLMLKSDAKNCASDGKPVAQDADADAKTSKVAAAAFSSKSVCRQW